MGKAAGGQMSTVLVVEDDAGIRDAVAYNLGLDGHDVLTAADGTAGLELARSRRPDAVILDVMLPRMSGLDVCRILRAETAIPILLLTARDAEPDRVQGLELGADDYVTKPFSMRELRARVGSMLRRDDLSRHAGLKTEESPQAVTRPDQARAAPGRGARRAASPGIWTARISHAASGAGPDT